MLDRGGAEWAGASHVVKQAALQRMCNFSGSRFEGQGEMRRAQNSVVGKPKAKASYIGFE